MFYNLHSTYYDFDNNFANSDFKVFHSFDIYLK